MVDHRLPALFPDKDLTEALIRAVRLGRAFTDEELPYVAGALISYAIHLEKGEVTVSTNSKGECVAVTRTDDEHRILSIIWQKGEPSPDFPDVESVKASVREA